MSFSHLLSLVGALLLAALTAPAQSTTPPAGPAAAGTTITVVRVRTPWYGFRWLLKRGFRRAVPEYAAIPGLQQKDFTTTPDGGFFGGIYLWHDAAAARAWFSPDWHARVQRRYGVAGQVEYYEVLDRETFAPTPPTDDDAYAVLAFGQPTPADGTAGLVRRTALRETAGARRAGVLTLWTSRAAAERHYGRTGSRADVQFFAAPVLLDRLTAVAGR